METRHFPIDDKQPKVQTTDRVLVKQRSSSSPPKSTKHRPRVNIQTHQLLEDYHENNQYQSKTSTNNRRYSENRHKNNTNSQKQQSQQVVGNSGSNGFFTAQENNKENLMNLGNNGRQQSQKEFSGNNTEEQQGKVPIEYIADVVRNMNFEVINHLSKQSKEISELKSNMSIMKNGQQQLSQNELQFAYKQQINEILYLKENNKKLKNDFSKYKSKYKTELREKDQLIIKLKQDVLLKDNAIEFLKQQQNFDEISLKPLESNRYHKSANNTPYKAQNSYMKDKYLDIIDKKPSLYEKDEEDDVRHSSPRINDRNNQKHNLQEDQKILTESNIEYLNQVEAQVNEKNLTLKINQKVKNTTKIMPENKKSCNGDISFDISFFKDIKNKSILMNNMLDIESFNVSPIKVAKFEKSTICDRSSLNDILEQHTGVYDRRTTQGAQTLSKNAQDIHQIAESQEEESNSKRSQENMFFKSELGESKNGEKHYGKTKENNKHTDKQKKSINLQISRDFSQVETFQEDFNKRMEQYFQQQQHALDESSLILPVKKSTQNSLYLQSSNNHSFLLKSPQNSKARGLSEPQNSSNIYKNKKENATSQSKKSHLKTNSSITQKNQHNDNNQTNYRKHNSNLEIRQSKELKNNSQQQIRRSGSYNSCPGGQNVRNQSSNKQIINDNLAMSENYYMQSGNVNESHSKRAQSNGNISKNYNKQQISSNQKNSSQASLNYPQTPNQSSKRDKNQQISINQQQFDNLNHNHMNGYLQNQYDSEQGKQQMMVSELMDNDFSYLKLNCLNKLDHMKQVKNDQHFMNGQFYQNINSRENKTQQRHHSQLTLDSYNVSGPQSKTIESDNRYNKILEQDKKYKMTSPLNNLLRVNTDARIKDMGLIRKSNGSQSYQLSGILEDSSNNGNKIPKVPSQKSTGSSRKQYIQVMTNNLNDDFFMSERMGENQQIQKNQKFKFHQPPSIKDSIMIYSTKNNQQSSQKFKMDYYSGPQTVKGSGY